MCYIHNFATGHVGGSMLGGGTSCKPLYVASLRPQTTVNFFQKPKCWTAIITAYFW